MRGVRSLWVLLVAMGLQPAILRKPRIREMYDLEIRHGGRHVAYMRVFEGRRPHYRGWVEVYGVDWDVAKGPIERAIAAAVYRSLEPNEHIFFEYVGDWVTESQLQRGVPPENTRLGKILRSVGFVSIRDMYYPEGFMEGGPKLQARKPSPGEARDEPSRSRVDRQPERPLLEPRQP